MSGRVSVSLRPAYWTGGEHRLLDHHGIAVSLFRYPSSVEAVRVRTARAEIVVLPFQGMQVWDAVVDGRPLKMKAMRLEPVPTRSYLDGFGAFFVHCGFTVMGVPGAGDTHPLHGELHNAPFTDAVLETGEDGHGAWAAVTARYRHTVAFSYDYLAESRVTLREGGTLVGLELTVTNLKRTPMEYLYMAHPNFRPVDGGRFVYSARSTRENVRVRRSIPPHMKAAREYVDLLDAMAVDPARHHVLAPGQAFDPELVFFIDRYETDGEGWAHSMLVHPDGYASYVRHRPAEFDHVVRWICRTPDQDCLGIALPSTAEPEGMAAERAKGNVKTAGPGQRLHFGIEAGLLAPVETAAMEHSITRIMEVSQ